MKSKSSLILLIIAFFIVGCTKKERKFSLNGFAQGTYYQISYYSKDSIITQATVDSFFMAFDEIASLWNPNSMISKINSNQLQKVSMPFKRMFQMAYEVSNATDGALDCTIGNIVNVWGFGKDSIHSPSQQTIDSLMKFVGFHNVFISSDNTIHKLYPETKLDFNAIAKGFSVDMLAQKFHTSGIHNFIIDVGGEIAVSGKKQNDDQWIIGIESPAATATSERNVQIKLKLTNTSIATSGSYRKYYEENGIRYSHTIDPQTGRPVNHSLLSATVITEKCAIADAFATAFMVMGTEKTIEFLKSHTQLQVYLIYCGEDGLLHTWQTDGFKDFIVSDL